MLRASIALVALTLAACHPPRPAYIGVRGEEISSHLEQMRRDGEAQVSTVMVVPGKGMQPADFETVFFYQTVTVGKLTTSIESLAAGCSPDTAGDCALARYRDTPLKLRDLAREPRKEAKPNRAGPIIAGGLALASLGGMVYCIAECTSNRGLKSMGLGFGAAILGLVSYVLAGGTIRD